MEQLTQKEKDAVLKRFVMEHFPFTPLRKSGFFTPEMRGDYKAQTARVCEYFGYETVYEYGVETIRCHLSVVGKRPDDMPFITEIGGIYD